MSQMSHRSQMKGKWQQNIQGVIAGVPEEIIEIGTQHLRLFEHAPCCPLEPSQAEPGSHQAMSTEHQAAEGLSGHWIESTANEFFNCFGRQSSNDVSM